MLIYQLPALAASGTADVGEPGTKVGFGDAHPSDIVFFTNSNGVNDHRLDANLIILYSADIGGGLLADTGLPSFAGSLIESVSEDANGNFQYLPSLAPFPNGAEYDGFSGAVPEPGALTLIGLATATVRVRRRRA